MFGGLKKSASFLFLEFSGVVHRSIRGMFEGGLYGRVVEAVLVEVESRSGVKADVDEPGPEVDVDAIEAAPELEVDTDADGEAPEVDVAEAEAANVDKAGESDADTAGAALNKEVEALVGSAIFNFLMQQAHMSVVPELNRLRPRSDREPS